MKETKALFIDWETSGLSADRHQGLSLGAAVVNINTFEPIDTLYLEFKFDKKYEWQMEAERVHGLTREYLEENGMTSEEGLAELLEFILKHWSGNDYIVLGGHNIGFDHAFLRQLFDSNKFPMLKLHSLRLDSQVLGAALLGKTRSDDVFTLLGCQDERGQHNSLDDALQSAQVFKNAREVFNMAMEG